MIWLKRLFLTLHSSEADERLEREFTGHLNALEEDFRRQGMNAAEARLAAKRAFGPVQQRKEEYREQRGFTALEQLGRDFVFGLRNLRRSPGFTLVALFSLVFGIGVNAAIFTLLNGLVLETLRVRHPERVMEVQAFNQPLNEYQNFFSYPFYRELAENSAIFDAVTAQWPSQFQLSRQDGSTTVSSVYVSGSYFRFLSASPYLGRLLTEADDAGTGGGRVCVLSYKLWTTKFSADPQVVGKAIDLEKKPVEVVGVTGPEFTGLSLQNQPDVTVPMAALNYLTGGMDRDSPHILWLQILAKLKAGIDLPLASQRLNSLATRITETLPKDRPDSGITSYRLKAAPRGFDRWDAMSRPLFVLMSTVALVLLIACLNLANLLLARGQERELEIATRLSLGASRWRVARQLLIENIHLAAGGALLGLGLANILIAFLLREFNKGKTYGLLDVSLDTRVIVFTALIAVGAVLLFGAVPAWLASNAQPANSLQGRRMAAGRKGQTAYLRRSLFVIQVVLTMVLLFGAALFERSLRNLRAVQVGSDPDHLILADITFGGALGQSGVTDTFLDELRNRVVAIPGMVSVAYGAPSPLSGLMLASSVDIPGRTPNNSALQSFWTNISPNYFRTLGLPLLAGRDFTAADRDGSPRVAIVNQKFVSTYFPGENPLGKQFRGGMNGNGPVTIVGVVANLPSLELTEERKNMVYTPLLQSPREWQVLTVRVRGNPEGFEHQLADLIHNIAPAMPLQQLKTMAVQRDSSIARQRLLALLSSMFGALALFLSAVGLYGLVSYSVARRTREIGIRVSVGASPVRVFALFLRENLALVVMGTIAGAVLALGATRLVRSLLYGVPNIDLSSLYIAAALLFAVALAATLIPASRAMHVDPAEALRSE